MASSSAPAGQDRSTCLVAVDDDVAGVPALVWALRHAAAHGMRVEVLTVWPPHRSVLVHDVPGHFSAPRWSAHRAQAEIVRQAVEAVPERPALSVTLENGDAASEIVRASAGHDLVVLGAGPPRGRHRLTDRIVRDSSCGVVVVDSSTGRPRSRAVRR